MVYKDNPALRQVTVLEAQWTDLPEDVVEDVRRLWRNRELGNDDFYASWDADDFYTTEDPDDKFRHEYKYPAIAKYLRDNDVEECLIHYWW
jgi:hypothetical protein